MNAVLQPFHVLAVIFAGWSNRHQQRVIEYLLEENRAFKQQLGNRKLRLTDAQRARLAVKGKALGHKVLNEVAIIVTPDTIMRWHRRLIALKWAFPSKRLGRPGIMKVIEQLTIRIAKQNPSFGYEKIQGSLKNLGHRVAETTIANILKRNGIEPAPERRKRTSWRAFLRAHWESIASTDFFTTEVWTKSGLRTYYILFVIELHTRRVHIAGITPHPNVDFMAQIARNLTDPEDGFLTDKRFLIHDRDAKFTKQFVRILTNSGVESVRCPARAPNCNAYAEQFVRTIKEECLSRMIFFGERSLRNAITEFTIHYHEERNHQELGNRLIEPNNRPSRTSGHVRCRERLGGLLRYYHRNVG